MAWMMWIVGALLIVMLVFLTIVWIRGVYIPQHEWQRLGIPGPPIRPFWGNSLQLTELGDVGAARKWVNRYGKVCGFYAGRRKFLIVADIKMLKEIMVKEFDVFTDREYLTKSALEGTGRGIPPGLLMTKGERWRRIRHILSHTFTSKKLKLMVAPIASSCDTLVDKFGEIADSGKNTCVWKLCGSFTMETILAAAFGRQVNIMQGEADHLTKAAADIFKIMQRSMGNKNIMGRNRFIALLSYFPQLRKLARKASSKSSLADAYQKIVDTAFMLLEARRRMDTPPQTKDFLQLLLEAHADEEGPTEAEADSVVKPAQLDKKTLTDTEIVGVSVEFILAAYETTSNTLGFTAYCMALNPDKQNKLCQEIDNYYSEHPDVSLYEASQSIPYVEWVINETLRMYPPAGRTIRYCKKTIVIHGVTIPEGTVVHVAIDSIHHDPDIYSDPESYIPERFSPEQRVGFDPLTHIPFGWGPRQCIGKRFAIMEMKMALIHCFRRFKFVRVPETQVPVKLFTSFTTGPVDDIILKVVRRD